MTGQVFVFSGQGSQYQNMGKDLFEISDEAKKLLDLADTSLDYKVSDIMFGNQKSLINQTEYTQPALLTLAVAQYNYLKSKYDFQPIIMAGHSLGEYAALVCSGSLDFVDALKLVSARGKLMSTASQDVGVMAAVQGIEVDELQRLVSNQKSLGKLVTVSNINGKNNNVISGLKADVDSLVELLEEKGATVIFLNVSAAFHSPLMHEAAIQFAELLDEVEFQMPNCQVISNVDALPYQSISEIKEKLSMQIESPVNWLDTIKYMIERRLDCIVEIGAKCQLQKMLLQDYHDLKVLSFDKEGDLQMIEELLSIKNEQATVSSEYSFISRLLGVIVSTPNKNFDTQDYNEKVILPYNELVKKNEDFIERDYYPSIEEIIELVKKLQDILTAKQVPVLEQIDRINDLLLEAKLEDQKDEILQKVY
ncbi:ACP S-malonyltransferase [Streptococcus mutans]|nr:ACP S-malonyltransferase [Streptococcus mutans]